MHLIPTKKFPLIYLWNTLPCSRHCGSCVRL